MKGQTHIHKLLALIVFLPILFIQPATQLTQPNIVLILTDDQTFESLQKMPFLSSRKWFNFTNTYVNVSLCCPSRATILSGKYSHKSGVENNLLGELHDETNDIAARLNAAGYSTAYYGKYLNSFPFGRELHVPIGWDKWGVFFNNSQDYYNYTLMDENLVMTTFSSDANSYSTDVLAKKAEGFAKTAKPPFFLYFAPYAPHQPFTPAPRHLSADVGIAPRYPNYNEEDVSDKPNWIQSLPMRDDVRMDNHRLNQYQALLAVDEAVKRITQVLQNRKIFYNTIVIFTSDNGYSLGEHRYTKKLCEYDECLHVPLLIRYPKLAGREIPQLVSNIDIAPTIAALAGVSQEGFDGVSLLPLLTDAGVPWREEVLIHWGGGDPWLKTVPSFWGVRTAEWKYVEIETGEKELYNLIEDPYELNNLAGNPDYDPIILDLQARLERLKQ